MANAIDSDDDPKITQQGQDSAETLYLEGLEYRQRGEYETAAKKFSQAIDRGRKTALAYYYLGEALIQLKRNEEALANLSEAIRLDPKDVRALAVRAIVHERRGAHEAALTDFSRALVIQPNKLTTLLHEGRGRTYWNMELLHEAIEDFTKMVVQDPGNPRGYFWRGFAYGCLKEYDMGLQDFTALIQKRPEDGTAHAYRGWIHNRLENYRLSETDLTYAIDHGFRQPFGYLNLADSLAAQGHIDQALKINNEVFSLGEARVFAQAFFQRGGFLLLVKRYDEARSFYEKGIYVANKLGMRNVILLAIADMNEALEGNSDIKKPGEDILQLLKEAQKQVQSNSKYDTLPCGLQSPESKSEMENLSGIVR